MSEIKEMTIEQVLEAVENGKLTATEALELEKAGKNRSTLIEQLESMIADDVEPEDKKVKVTLLKNIKYNTDRYKIGEEIEIDPKDVEPFIKAGIIAGD